MRKFGIPPSFYDAICKKDITGLRIIMKDSLLVDPTSRQFDAMVDYSRFVKGLYDSHDGRPLNKDKSSWDDDYMNELMVQVVSNFSRERINHLKDVVRHISRKK